MSCWRHSSGRRHHVPFFFWMLIGAIALSVATFLHLNSTLKKNDDELGQEDYSAVAAPPPKTSSSAGAPLTNPKSIASKEKEQVQQNVTAQGHDNNNETRQELEGATNSKTGAAAHDNNDKQKYKEDDNNDNREARKPLNIVLLYADDWSFNSLGVAGNDYIQTPVLDNLAKQGVFFTHNCVVSSVCMQSRATLYTGQYSSRHQTLFAYRNITMYQEGRWNQTLYPLMMNAGYHVGFFGKYHHLENFPPDVPTFSQFKSMPFQHYVERDGETRHITEWNMLDGLEFLQTKPKDQPFFLTVSFFATHAEDGTVAQYRPMESSMHLYKDTPVPLPKTYTRQHWEQMPYFFNDQNIGRQRFFQRYRNHAQYQHMMKNTYRMVTEVDAACGTIIQHLNETHQLDNTLVIFTTDNGNLHGQHGLAEKWYAYEESLRVPLIIWDPRLQYQGGVVDNSFTLNIDLAPTILSAAGVVVPDVMQGRDLADLYLRQKPGRQEFLYEFWDNNPNIPNSVALVQKNTKFIYWNDYKYHQVFDLKHDPMEEHDLYNATNDEVVRNNFEYMMRWQAQIRSGEKQ